MPIKKEPAKRKPKHAKNPVKRISGDANTRAKIQTTLIVNRLTKHIGGTLDMSPTQVQAALGLLKKTLPDQKAMEMSGDLNVTQVIIKDLTGE